MLTFDLRENTTLKRESGEKKCQSSIFLKDEESRISKYPN
jgi:hypothetical protein